MSYYFLKSWNSEQPLRSMELTKKKERQFFINLDILKQYLTMENNQLKCFIVFI